MITLSNGDKWVIDGSEWKDQGIPYEEACKGNIPETDVRDFVSRLCSYHNCEDEEYNDDFILPRKLTVRDSGKGYWDCNFNVFEEVLEHIAIASRSNPWSKIYKMEWGEVVVVFQRADSGGYDTEVVVKVYEGYEDYYEDVRLGEDF